MALKIEERRMAVRAVLLAGLVAVSMLDVSPVQAKEFKEERFHLCRNLESNLAQIMGRASYSLARLRQDRENVRNADPNDKDLFDAIGGVNAGVKTHHWPE